MFWNWIHKTIYQFLFKIRNPSLIPKLDELKVNANKTATELRNYQRNKLIALLKHAENHVPYWRNHFSNNPIDYTNSTQTILNNLPITTKEELIKQNQKRHSGFKFGRRIKAKTSGSTGEPLVFYKNETWDSANRAAMLRGYSWYGVTPWDRAGYLWGYRFRGIQKWKTWFIDSLLNQFRLFSYDQKQIMQFAQKLTKAQYLTGYTSVIAKLSKQLNELNEPVYWQGKMIKYTSEKPNAGELTEIEKAFGRKAISEYGSAETGIISFECPYGTHHINMESVIVEEINGEAIITNLNSLSFPIIRYQLGDIIKLGGVKKCKCGLETEVLVEVTGRLGKLVYGKIQNYPSLIFYNIFKVLNRDYHLPLSYQVIQRRKGQVMVQIEQSPTDKELRHVKQIFHEYFGQDIDVNYKLGHEIIYEGKRKDFISLV